MSVSAFIKKEPVLSISAVLAVISCFVVHPSAAYLSYINWRTLVLLFGLMTIVSGARRAGLFAWISRRLTSGISTVRRLSLVFLLLCFVLSMFITNDVALVTLIPLTLLSMKDVSEKDLILTLVFETIAANLGSMLLPFGNPQNLYLSSYYDISMGSFVLLMLPYTLASLLALFLQNFLVSNDPLLPSEPRPKEHPNLPGSAFYAALFAAALLAIARVLNFWIFLVILLVLVTVFDRKAFAGVNYTLLLTFAAFFILIGNLGQMPAIRSALSSLLQGREFITSVLASQLISNVPAAILLSGFADPSAGSLLVIGTNLGGLGTLIASMASLITWQLYASRPGAHKGLYLGLFTLWNAADLILLSLLHFLI